MRLRFLTVSVAVLCTGCDDGPSPAAAQSAWAVESSAGPFLTVTPSSVTVGERVEGMTFDFRLPAAIIGGGAPAGLYNGFAEDNSVMQIELPLQHGPDSTDEQEHASGFARFDEPVLCWVTDRACVEGARSSGQDGFWRAFAIRPNQTVQELQLAKALMDASLPGIPNHNVLGVYVPDRQRLAAGTIVRLRYTGHVPSRATDWTDRPFLTHLRYRTSLQSEWVTLDTDTGDVGALQILAGSPAFVRVLAPLDVGVQESFVIAVVVTDRTGNPTRWTGTAWVEGVDPRGPVQIEFVDAWRGEREVQIDDEGFHVLSPSLEGAGVRAVDQVVRAWRGSPPYHRLLGDIHIHTGDGGAQRKFLGVHTAGDHAALYSRTQDALAYLDQVAGYDFGAVSEHSSADAGYAFPASVADSTEFRDGGACHGKTSFPFPVDTGWWTVSQQSAHEYQEKRAGHFVVFPAYEWHAQHIPDPTDPDADWLDWSPLHRVVLFRDFADGWDLPLLPGDTLNVSPRCLFRFLELVGYGPEQALVVPHMMMAVGVNLDWDLTYADTSVAPCVRPAEYQTVGEIFSARSEDNAESPLVEQGPEGHLTLFEGEDGSETWSYRYGWRDLDVRIGLIGSSDNHSQTPGANDDVALDGERYHLHEPGGTAVVLARSRDPDEIRDAIHDALQDRATYATTGVRAWLSFDVDGSPMGSEIDVDGAIAQANVELAVAMPIRRIELWSAQAGIPDAPYEIVWQEEPEGRTVSRTIELSNPLASVADLPRREAVMLYYVRAFLDAPGAEGDEQPEDAVWSSPIWVRWADGSASEPGWPLPPLECAEPRHPVD